VWGINTYGVIPDILITAKGSRAASIHHRTLYRDPLDRFLHDNPFIHVSTFGGSEGLLCCAASVGHFTRAWLFEHVRRMRIASETAEPIAARHPALYRYASGA